MATLAQSKKRLDKLQAQLDAASTTRNARIERKRKELLRKYGSKPPRKSRSHSTCDAEEAAQEAQLEVAAQSAIDAHDALLQSEYEEAFYAYLWQVWQQCLES